MFFRTGNWLIHDRSMSEIYFLLINWSGKWLRYIQHVAFTLFYLSYRIINFLRLELWFVFTCAFQRMLYIWAKYGLHGVCSVSTQELDFFQSIHLDFSCNNGLATGYNNGKWETLVKCLLFVQKLRVFTDGIISWVFGWVSLRDCNGYIFFFIWGIFLSGRVWRDMYLR